MLGAQIDVGEKYTAWRSCNGIWVWHVMDWHGSADSRGAWDIGVEKGHHWYLGLCSRLLGTAWSGRCTGLASLGVRFGKQAWRGFCTCCSGSLRRVMEAI